VAIIGATCYSLPMQNCLIRPVRQIKTIGLLLVFGSGLTACSDANHLGNPLTLPIRAVTAAVENSAYDRERAGVKTWIIENEAAMRAEGFAGPVTGALLATLPSGRRAQAQRDFIEASAYPDFTERATVVVMVLRE